jgi:hypothetical protein
MCYNSQSIVMLLQRFILTILILMYRISLLLSCSVCRNFTVAALERVAARVTAKVEDAACDSDGWTAAQFADAALLLLDSSDNAVTKQQMEQQLGRHLTDDVDKQQVNGKATLEALVKANRLSLRPDSEWALDIPRDRFQAKAVIVTAPSAVDLHAMENMRSQLEQTVQKWEQRQQVCRVVSSIVSLQVVYTICTIL